MTLTVKHSRIAQDPVNPDADISTGDWNDLHVITGTLSVEEVGFEMPDFSTYFFDSDPPGAPLPPSQFSGYAGFTNIVLTWELPDAYMWTSYELFEGVTPDFAPGAVLQSLHSLATTVPHEAGSGPWYYKLRARNTRNEFSDFVTAGPFTLQTIASVAIGHDAIIEDNLAPGSVDLASSTVTGILAGTHVALSDDAVLAQHIADGAVHSNHLASESVLGTHIGSEEVSTGHIATGSITNVLVADGSIASSKLKAGTLEIQLSCFGNLDLSHPKFIGSLNGTKILDMSIPASKIDLADFRTALFGDDVDVEFTGLLRAAKFSINEPWAAATSDDGVWIQDSGATSYRMKIYFDNSVGSHGRFYIARAGQRHYINADGTF